MKPLTIGLLLVGAAGVVVAGFIVARRESSLVGKTVHVNAGDVQLQPNLVGGGGGSAAAALLNAQSATGVVFAVRVTGETDAGLELGELLSATANGKTEGAPGSIPVQFSKNAVLPS